MAKSERAKVSPEERLHKSLVAAAKILNKKMHMPVEARRIASADNQVAMLAAKVVIHQVWCNDENAPVEKPTTDGKVAERIRDDHEQHTGHSCRIISSN